MSLAGNVTDRLFRGGVLVLIVLCVAAVRPGFSGSRGDASENQRRSTLRAIALAYFDGLGKRDLSQFPYDDQISLRAPLNPAGGSDSPIVGRNNVLAYFAKVLPTIASVSVRDTYINEALTIVCAEATVGVVTPVINTALRVADCFTVNEAGRVTEQENHFDPRAVTHPQKYLDFPKQYFTALASSDENTLKKLLLGNLADTFRGRAPLTAPGTSEEELIGPQAWVDYIVPFLPAIKSQRLLWSGAEGDQVCGMAYVGIAQGVHDADTPHKRLRLVDCWKFDPITGKIVAQENFYDPRPALPPCTSCGGTATRGCSCPK